MRTQPIVIICDDDLLHTDERPYCYDMSCPCTEDLLEEALAEIASIEADRGLISRQDTQHVRIHRLRQWWNEKTDPDQGTLR